MNIKYKKRSNNIFQDYEFYIEQEDLFHVAFFNFYTNEKDRNKCNYIWKSLLKQHKEI
jgi:hypothetical protein